MATTAARFFALLLRLLTSYRSYEVTTLFGTQAAERLAIAEFEYSIGKRSFILYATSVLLVALTFFMMLRM